MILFSLLVFQCSAKEAHMFFQLNKLILSHKFAFNCNLVQLYRFTICVQIWANKHYYKQFNTLLL